jgi:hypothetical protein
MSKLHCIVVYSWQNATYHGYDIMKHRDKTSGNRKQDELNVAFLLAYLWGECISYSMMLFLLSRNIIEVFGNLAAK